MARRSRGSSASANQSVPGGHASQPRFGNYPPGTPEEARANVRELKAAGVDGVKLIYSDQAHTGRPPLPVMLADIMRAMIDEAHAQGLKAFVHAPTLAHAKEVLRAGADALVHSVSDFPGGRRVPRADAEESPPPTRRRYRSTRHFPTSRPWMESGSRTSTCGISSRPMRSPLSQFGGRQGHTPCVLRHRSRQTISHMQNATFDGSSIAGFPVLAGTDTGVTGVLLGVSSQMELTLLVESGLTPAEARRAATINPATALGREKDLGTVEVNKLADLVIIDGDPLTNISNITRYSSSGQRRSNSLPCGSSAGGTPAQAAGAPLATISRSPIARRATGASCRRA